MLRSHLQRTLLFGAVSLSRKMSPLLVMQGMRYKVYTRTGDKGTSSLYSGERRRKDDPVFEALGDLDELNANIGLIREYLKDPSKSKLEKQLELVQSRLMDVGGHIATPRMEQVSQVKIKRTQVDPAWITMLESWIDEMDLSLKPLTRFILPSGGVPATLLHVSRTICRRAERKVVALASEGGVDENAVKFMNRLSDFLFTAARYSTVVDGRTETSYYPAFHPESNSSSS